MNLNFYPINFEFEDYQISKVSYSEDRLLELRGKHNHTHSFFRNGDELFISNKDGDEDVKLGETETVSVYDDFKITSSLIKHLFFRTFKERFPSLKPIDFYPFRFFSRQEKDNVIYRLLPDDLKDKIAYKKLIEIQLRILKVDGKEQFGFIINIKRNWIFTKSCFELNEEGFNLIGIEVLRSEIFPGLESILAPNEEFIGVIKAVEKNKALVDTNEGIVKVDLKELFIKKNKSNIEKYLTYSISETKSREIFEIIEGKRSEIYNAKKLSVEINSIATLLFSERVSSKGYKQPILFQNKDGFCFTVENSLKRTTNSMNLRVPTFIFDHAGIKTKNNRPDSGLNDFGPYDSVNFDIKTPNVLCICHKDIRGSFTAFLANLIDGLPSSKYFKKGFKKKYDLHNVNLLIDEITSYQFENYNTIIRSELDMKPDLAIIEIPNEFRILDDEHNPYYSIKAKLLSLEIPVQFITTSKIKAHNDYILNSIALQLYAKIGGTPWVLPSNRSVDRELIIGIGNSWLRANTYKGAEQKRIVGITTFMSSDGQYLLGDKVKDVEYDYYFEELLSSLENSFERLKSEQGWSKGDTVRLIFHIFKPIKNIEYDVVSSLIKKFEDFKIQFAFVTIGKRHPYKMFDGNEKGVPISYNSKQLKGENIPKRGTNIFLDSTTCLVQMLGARELKMHTHGMSNPIQIKIHMPTGNFEDKELDRLLFTDLNYIVQQIYSFTYLSWRSFLPGEKPASMLYSDLISKLLGKMRKVEGWDPDSLNYKLKRKKWFL
ncbi:Piwi domain-containing protein [uncultured Winogradskyella sp.]|uniref:Piwi domain-containing protein n=1 Tax=uncultured Winogradskyella sp. TaxID=395353 RepID=UPI002632786B|nr:Piwi domain-containing protein [uncultured Winogradskyella sp.]